MDIINGPISCTEKAQCRGWVKVSTATRETHFLVVLELKIDFTTRAEYWYIGNQSADVAQVMRLYGEVIVNELRHVALK